MAVSVLCPCLHCEIMLPGVTCGPRKRSQCARYLNYIQRLHRANLSHILISELKCLMTI